MSTIRFSTATSNALGALLGKGGVSELQSVLANVAASVGAYGHLPASLAVQPQMWIDPADRSTMDLEYAALFGSGASGAYLSTPDHADFDFNSGQKFTVEFWRNNTGRQDVLNGVDRGFVGQYNFNVNASWAISSGGSVNQGTSVRVALATNASGTSLATATTPASGLDWSHCVVVYDGTQETATDRAMIYLDGSLIDNGTYVFSGTLPANPNNSTAPLTIGRIPGVWNLADAALNRVRIWDASLLAGSVTELWNGGAGSYHSQLSAPLLTGLVASYDLTEASGRRDDLSGNGHHMAETGGVVPQAAIVMTLRTKGLFKYTLTPLTNGAAGTLGFGAAPRWLPTALNGSPCLQFLPRSALYAATQYPLNTATVEILEAVQYNAFADSETFLTMSADEDSAVAYLFTGDSVDSGERRMRFRFRDNNSPNNFNTDVRAHPILTTGTHYVSNWRGFGAGGTSSFAHRLNGVDSVLTYANDDAQDKSWANVVGRDNMSLGCLVRSDGNSTQEGKNFYLGPVIVYESLTTAQNLALEDYLNSLVGL